jgi:NADH:ubiquinone oxidoreductase subunit F (NADH-binding)
VHGLGAIAGALERVATGRHERRTVDDIERYAGQVTGRGACRFPDGAVRFVTSALEVFGDHVREHRAGRRCELIHRPPVLPLPVARETSWR